jgi:transposase
LCALGRGTRRPGLDRHHEPGDHPALRLDAEKKTRSASERDEPARQAWRQQAAAIEPTRWVFVDEFGSNVGMTRTHARSPRGERAHAQVPGNRGFNRTTLASLTLEGLTAGLVLDKAVTRCGFEVYVKYILAPTLRPNQIVVMDNLRQHHSEYVREAIEARGASLWFLPAYSPDLNPIEEAFSKIKTLLRSAGARVHEALIAAIATAGAAITPADARGYFNHGGYRPPKHRRPRRSAMTPDTSIPG